MSIITRASAPAHLFAIPELDHSEDFFARALDGQWFRMDAFILETCVEALTHRAVIAAPDLAGDG